MDNLKIDGENVVITSTQTQSKSDYLTEQNQTKTTLESQIANIQSQLTDLQTQLSAVQANIDAVS